MSNKTNIKLNDFNWGHAEGGFISRETHFLYYKEHINFIGYIQRLNKDMDKDQKWVGHTYIADDLHYLTDSDLDLEIVKYDLLVNTAILLRTYLSQDNPEYWN